MTNGFKAALVYSNKLGMQCEVLRSGEDFAHLVLYSPTMVPLMEIGISDFGNNEWKAGSIQAGHQGLWDFKIPIPINWIKEKIEDS